MCLSTFFSLYFGNLFVFRSIDRYLSCIEHFSTRPKRFNWILEKLKKVPFAWKAYFAYWLKMALVFCHLAHLCKTSCPSKCYYYFQRPLIRFDELAKKFGWQNGWPCGKNSLHLICQTRSVCIVISICFLIYPSRFTSANFPQNEQQIYQQHDAMSFFNIQIYLQRVD